MRARPRSGAARTGWPAAAPRSMAASHAAAVHVVALGQARPQRLGAGHAAPAAEELAQRGERLNRREAVRFRGVGLLEPVAALVPHLHRRELRQEQVRRLRWRRPSPARRSATRCRSGSRSRCPAGSAGRACASVAPNITRAALHGGGELLAAGRELPWRIAHALGVAPMKQRSASTTTRSGRTHRSSRRPEGRCNFDCHCRFNVTHTQSSSCSRRSTE